jgi:hypothetical protein
MKRILYVTVYVAVFSCFLLAGCGGGGGAAAPAAPAAPAVASVSGVAAAGAPLSGTVFLKDASTPATALSQSIAADGSFSFDVTNLTAPFLLKAVGTSGGQNFTLFSFNSDPGVTNINPLSHLTVVQANGGADPSGLYETPDPAKIQAISAALSAAMTDIRTALNQLLALVGAGAADFISDAFVADHTGLDLLFDLVSVSVGANTLSVVNKASGAPIFSAALNGGTLSGQIDAANLPAVPAFEETTAALPGDRFFTFALGVFAGGAPGEIMYNDLDGELMLPHASALPVTQAYDGIRQAPFGIYRDSNGATPPAFPADPGTVYVMRSIMGPAVQYYKLRIISATIRPDVASTNFGTVTFGYTPILPQPIVNAVGEWQFPDGSHLSVLTSTVSLDYTAADSAFFTIEGNYTDSNTLAGTFTRFAPDATGTVTVSLELTAEGKLNATLSGQAPLGSVTLTGGTRVVP